MEETAGGSATLPREDAFRFSQQGFDEKIGFEVFAQWFRE